jgi:hypothetical protein
VLVRDSPKTKIRNQTLSLICNRAKISGRQQQLFELGGYTISAMTTASGDPAHAGQILWIPRQADIGHSLDLNPAIYGHPCVLLSDRPLKNGSHLVLIVSAWWLDDEPAN